MLKQQKKPHAPVTPSDRNDSTRSETAERTMDSAPTASEINLSIDPVAYRYESWSEMADGWVESLRSTAKTLPDSDHDQIREITPLMPLSDVEALIEQVVLSRTVAIPHESTDITEETFPL